jgi:acetoin utilization protein AcuB
MDRFDSKRMQVLAALETLWQPHAGQTVLVEQVMTSEPVRVSPETTVPELVETFQDQRFRHLLVTDAEGRLRGVISDRDVLRMMGPGTAYKEVLEGILAGEIMSTDLVTIGRQTPVTDAIVAMVDHGISCLPVVDGDRPVGIMTSTDLHVLLQMLLQTLRTTGSEKPLTTVPR